MEGEQAFTEALQNLDESFLSVLEEAVELDQFQYLNQIRAKLKEYSEMIDNQESRWRNGGTLGGLLSGFDI